MQSDNVVNQRVSTSVSVPCSGEHFCDSLVLNIFCIYFFKLFMD